MVMKRFPLGGVLLSVATPGDCCVLGFIFKDLFVATFFFFS